MCQVEPLNPASAFPITGDKVTVHCNATAISTGEMIDSTYERCTAVTWTTGQGHAIPALEECVRMMRKGQKSRVRAPASLCFGDEKDPHKRMIGQGLCPQGSGLLLEVELVEVNESLMGERLRLNRERAEIARSSLNHSVTKKKA